MAVYTHLSDDELQKHLEAFPVGELVDARGVSAGTINTIYDLTTSRGRYILRLLEDRSLADARFEQSLLQHLRDRGLPVPGMMEHTPGDAVLSVSARKHLSVFEFVEGRELKPQDVEPAHVEQIGAFLARLHLATRSFPTRRASDFSPDRIAELVGRCERASLPPPVRRDVALLATELRRHTWPKAYPWGVGHGDLFIDNARFGDDALAGVIDFEMASNAPWIYDLAVAVCDWAFVEGTFHVERARALVSGYDRLRPLGSLERDGLYELCRYATCRYAVTRIYDFEVRARPEAQRLHKDYRHFLARLDAIRRLPAGGFRRALSATAEDDAPRDESSGVID